MMVLTKMMILRYLDIDKCVPLIPEVFNYIWRKGEKTKQMDGEWRKAQFYRFS